MPIDFLNRARGGGGASFYDFTLGALPVGVSFTRASTGWRFNSSGLFVSEVTDTPRFQYAPAVLTPRGLLIEDASVEQNTYNAQLDDASWVKSATTVTADQAVAPDGTTSMDLILEDATTASHSIRKGLTFYAFVSGTTYVFSAVVKPNGRDWFYIAPPAGAFGSAVRAYFNVTTGVLGTISAGFTAFIEPLGGGLYRCSCIGTASTSVSSTVTYSSTTADATPAPAGDPTKGHLLWNLSVQAGDCITSMIPTTAAAVTRAADVALITNPLALADQCWIVKGRTPSKITSGAVNVAFQVDDGTTGNNRRLIYGTDGKLHVIATVGGVDQCDLDLGVVAADANFAVAARFADNNFAASLNGGAIVTDTSGANPLGLTTARLGRRSDGYAWNSTIRSLRHQSTATNAELPLLAA